MISGRQLAANRANAQKSTGPKTAEGKARSSRNAVKHGVLAQVVPQETEGWKEMLLGLYESFRPANEMQRLLVEQIAVCNIRLKRSFAAQSLIMDCTEDIGMDATTQITLLNLQLRYMTTLQRAIDRCQKQLKDLKGKYSWPPDPTDPCPYIVPEEEAQANQSNGHQSAANGRSLPPLGMTDFHGGAVDDTELGPFGNPAYYAADAAEPAAYKTGTANISPTKRDIQR